MAKSTNPGQGTSNPGNDPQPPPESSPDTSTRIEQESVQTSGAGIITSDLRELEYDQNSASVSKKITLAQQSETKSEANQKESSGMAVTRKQIEQDVKNRQISFKKNQIDITRSKQKNQRNCNHKYDSTGKCLYCLKNRKTHLFD